MVLRYYQCALELLGYNVSQIDNVLHNVYRLMKDEAINSNLINLTLFDYWLNISLY